MSLFDLGVVACAATAIGMFLSVAMRAYCLLGSAVCLGRRPRPTSDAEPDVAAGRPPAEVRAVADRARPADRGAGSGGFAAMRSPA